MIAEEAGVRLAEIDPTVVERLRLLHEKTLTLEDEYQALLMQKNIFAFYAEKIPERAFSDNEQKVIRVGTLFTDIGKTGPKECRRKTQECVTEMFGIDDPVDPRSTVLQFLETFFPLDAPERAALLLEIGVRPESTMREFWNLHSKWTLQIISGSGVPPEAIPAAALHHMLEEMNPENIVGNDDRFTKYFGDNATFDRPEKTVIALDKYDAARRRGNKDHDGAIVLLRDRVKNNARFRDDQEFQQLIDDLEVILKDYPGYAQT